MSEAIEMVTCPRCGKRGAPHGFIQHFRLCGTIPKDNIAKVASNISHNEKKALTKLAVQNELSVSAMIRKLVRAALKAEGLL